MPSKKHTSVVLNKEVQKIKNELAGIYGLKNLLSAGILLFSRQTDSKQKALIKEINHLNSVDDRLTPDTVLSYVKEISLADFDIFDKKNPNIPVARMMITRTTNARSSGVLVNSRLDGSEFEPVNIYTGMLCRQTSKETLKAEKKAYKYQKKALKRQYKLMKIKAKQDVYKSLGENSKDKDVKSIKAGMIKVEK